MWWPDELWDINSKEIDFTNNCVNGEVTWGKAGFVSVCTCVYCSEEPSLHIVDSKGIRLGFQMLFSSVLTKVDGGREAGLHEHPDCWYFRATLQTKPPETSMTLPYTLSRLHTHTVVGRRIHSNLRLCRCASLSLTYRYMLTHHSHTHRVCHYCSLHSLALWAQQIFLGHRVINVFVHLSLFMHSCVCGSVHVSECVES